MKKKLLYISSPITPKECGIPLIGKWVERYRKWRNCMAARRVAIACWRRGYAVICPQMNTYFFPEGAVGSGVNYEDYLYGDFAILDKCDIVYMCEKWRESYGCRLEKEFALKRNKKVVYSMRQLKGKGK